LIKKVTPSKVINYSLSILVCIILTWFVYKQVKGRAHLADALALLPTAVSKNNIVLIISILLLMLINWGIEAYKWQQLLKPLQYIAYKRSLRSVFTGICISMFTPNRVGEYIGRIIYLKDVNKIKGITANIVGSLAQFIAACSFGIIGCLYHFNNKAIHVFTPWVAIVSIIALVLLVLGYSRLGLILHFVYKYKALQRIYKYINFVHFYSKKQLLQLIILSMLRYIVFALQYYLILILLGIVIPLPAAMLSIFLIYWLMAIVPTVAITEIPIRTELSYQVLQLYSNNMVGIMSASVLLWLINLILPALLGALLLIGAKWWHKLD
jgi:hypothetical protein